MVHVPPDRLRVGFFLLSLRCGPGVSAIDPVQHCSCRCDAISTCNALIHVQPCNSGFRHSLRAAEHGDFLSVDQLVPR